MRVDEFLCEECCESRRLLGVQPESSEKEVRIAYLDLMKVWHPDRMMDGDRLRQRAEQQTKRINAAYQHLGACPFGYGAVAAQGSGDSPESEPTGGEQEWNGSAAVNNAPSSGPTVSDMDGSNTPWRWMKLFLRVVWRLFKIASLAAIAALLILSLLFRLLEHFSEGRDGEHGTVRGWFRAVELRWYVADLLGVHPAAADGFLFSALLVMLAVGGVAAFVWTHLEVHPTLLIVLAVALGVTLVIWALRKEYAIEFAAASSRTNGTVAWVMGGLLLAAAATAWTVVGPWQRTDAQYSPATETVQHVAPAQATVPTANASTPVPLPTSEGDVAAATRVLVSLFDKGATPDEATAALQGVGYAPQGCGPRSDAPDYLDCRYTAGGGGTALLAFHDDNVQRVETDFAERDFDSVVAVLTEAFGTARPGAFDGSRAWGDMNMQVDASLRPGGETGWAMMTHGTFMPSSPPNAAEMQSSQPGSPADSTSIDATGMTSEAQESVKSAVLVWVESFRAKDAAKNAACYAPLVDRYFRRNNVSREQVQQYKQTAFEQMLDIRKFDVSNVRIEVVPSFQRAENSVHYDRVSAVFQKEWDDTESTGMTFSGREIEKLTFTSSSEGWKIVREEEVEIIEVHRERAELSTYSSRDTSVSEGALNVIPPSSTPLSDLSGNWQGEYTNHDTNEVRKVTLQISRHDADLTGTLIFDPGGGNAASCTITGVYNDQKKFMLLKIADCQGHPPAYLQGYIGFSSIELTARQVFGVDPSHNGWLNINKQ